MNVFKETSFKIEGMGYINLSENNKSKFYYFEKSEISDFIFEKIKSKKIDKKVEICLDEFNKSLNKIIEKIKK